MSLWLCVNIWILPSSRWGVSRNISICRWGYLRMYGHAMHTMHTSYEAFWVMIELTIFICWCWVYWPEPDSYRVHLFKKAGFIFEANGFNPRSYRVLETWSSSGFNLLSENWSWSGMSLLIQLTHQFTHQFLAKTDAHRVWVYLVKNWGLSDFSLLISKLNCEDETWFETETEFLWRKLNKLLFSLT